MLLGQFAGGKKLEELSQAHSTADFRVVAAAPPLLLDGDLLEMREIS